MNAQMLSMAGHTTEVARKGVQLLSAVAAPIWLRARATRIFMIEMSPATQLAAFVHDYVETAMPDLREMIATEVRPTLGRITPILRVTDLDASIAYYVDRLGFSVEWRADPVASLRRDAAALMLSAGDQGQPGTWVWTATSDVDALYEELRHRGARLRHPPTNYPWGSRECQVSDPDGHVLRFGADLRAGEPMGEWLDGDGRRWLPEPDGRWRAAD